MSFFQSLTGFGTANDILVQTPSGGAVGTNFHIIFGTINVGASTTTTITWPSAVPFTAFNTYAAAVSSDDPVNHSVTVFNQTATSFQFRNSDAGGPHNYMYIIIGY